jgi:hypothetical protein
MFKRFADRNSGAFLFAASSDDESELDSSDGEFDDEMLAQQQRERREKHELDLKNRVGREGEGRGGAREGAHIRGTDEDDDDVIIMNDGEAGERVKKTVTSTSVPNHVDTASDARRTLERRDERRDGVLSPKARAKKTSSSDSIGRSREAHQWCYRWWCVVEKCRSGWSQYKSTWANTSGICG